MVFSYLILLLASLYHAQAGWVCPNSTLDDSTTRFPPAVPYYNSSYASGLNCTIKISVKKGQYLDLSFFNMVILPGDYFSVYDETGTNYNDAATGLPLIDVITGTNLYIKVVTKSSGTLAFQTRFPSILQNNIYSYTIPSGQTTTLDLLDTQWNSSSIVTSNSPIAILGAVIYPMTDMFNAQSTFIFGGDATNGTYLGSAYSFYNTKRTIIYDKPPYKVTIYQTYNELDGCLLFREAASIENIDYYFALKSINVDNVTLQLDSNGKPAVATVYNRDAQDFWLTSLSMTSGQVDWLPGSSLPPAIPNLSFNSGNSISQAPQRIPGYLNTFSTNSSAVTINLLGRRSDLDKNLPIGVSAYAPSINYNIANKQQNLSYRITNHVTSNVTFTVIHSFNYFSIQSASMAGKTTNYNMSSGSMTLLLSSYTIDYVEAGTDNDVGGLLKFEVLPPPKFSPQQTTWIWVIALIFTYSQ